MLIFSISVLAQDAPKALVEGRITNAAGKKLPGATVTVKRNGSTFTTVTTSSSGKYENLELPMGFTYTLTVSIDGYVSKEIAIDAKSGYYEEDSPEVIPLDIPFSLDEKKPDVDYSPVSNGFQIGKLAIDPATGGLAPDMSYTSNQKKKYEKFFTDLEKAANKEEEDFKKFIENGDKAFQAGNYDEALTNYNSAKEIKQDDPGVAGKITTTEQKIEQKKSFDKTVTEGDNALNAKNFDEAIAKYEKAKSILPEDKNIDQKIKDAKDAKAAAEGAELAAKFKAKMDEANKAFADKDYAYAKTLYQEAGKIKPDEKEPPVKIKECEDIIKKQLEEEQKFNELVAAGDKGMLDENYDTAIEKYTAALEIKDDSRVKTELQKAKDLKKKQEEDAAAAEKQAQFDQLIASGDGKLGSEDFDGAISEYQKALAMNVDNATANAKIKEAQDAKKAKEDEEAAAAKKAEFDALIASGDGKLGSEDFDAAISEYQKALALNVDNTTANAKIKEAQDAKKAKEDEDAAAARQAEFDEFIASGDSKLGSEEFSGAIGAYQSALKLGVDDATANAKIQEAERLRDEKLAADEAAAQKVKFDEFIASGDGKLGNEDFAGAIADYQEALKLGVDDPTANAKIKEAEKLRDEKLAADEAAAQKAKFDELIASGDGKLGSEDFTGAISDYQDALKLGVDDATANAKIKEAERLRDEKSASDEAAAQKAKFDELIASGDGKLGSEDFDGAIADYQDALKLGVDDPTATAKIKEAEKLRDEKLAADEAAAQKAKFDELIASGDGKLGSEDFVGAIMDYQNALKLGVDDAMANAKIKEAEKLRDAKNDAAATAAQFEELIASGDGKLGSEDFDGAIADYQKALALGVDDPTANAKIQEAERLRDEKASSDAAAAEKAKFDELIASGDEKLGSEDFVGAITDYQKALKLGVDDPTATAKIKEAEALRDAKSDAAAAAAQFAELIASGDGKLGSEDFDGAIEDYQKALALGIDDPTATAKIKEAEKLRDAKSAAENAAAEKAKFDELIASGDGKLGSEDFVGAIADYQKALALGVDDPTATAKIKEAEKLRDAKLAADSEAEKQAKFDKYISDGDGYLASESFDMAISTYQSALDLNVNNTLANTKIKEAQDAKKAFEQNAAASAKDQEFNDLLAKGDAAKNAKSWEEAKSFYSQAKEVKTESPIPQQKIDEVNELMKLQLEEEQNAQLQKYLDKGKEITDAGEYEKAIGLYTKAKSLFPGETILDDRIKEVTALKAKEDEYKKFIASADTKYEGGKWQEAKADYQKAIAVFDRPWPNEQIANIDKKIEEEAAANDAANAMAEKKAEYDALMTKGKSQKDSKKYQEAIATYTQAKNLLPSESEPQKRIDEINKLLSDMANASALIEKYEAAIAKADAKRDEAIAAKSDDLAIAAKGLYSDANKIKSDESYPQEQVDRLSNLMEEWAKDAADKQYQKIIDKADELFAAKNWDGAQKLYERANDLKPVDPYPPAQLEKIKNARANAGKLDSYNEFIAEGNSLFQEQKYQTAIKAYENALGVKPGAKYPKDKIAEIKQLISDMAKAEQDKKDKENALELDPNYLGEEVSMSEEEIDKMWKDVRVDEVTSKDKAYEDYRESHSDENEEELTYQSERSETINENFDQMEEDREDLYEMWDTQRKDILPEMADFKERENNKLADFYDVERSRSIELNEYYDDEEEVRKDYQLSLDEQREDNITDMEKYKYDQSEFKEDLTNTETDVTHENNEYYFESELEREEVNQERDVRRTDNITDMEKYKFDQSEFKEDLTDAEVDVTYENNDYYFESAQEREETNQERDVRRADNIVEMDDYIESQDELNKELVNQGVTTTYDTHGDYAEMAEEFKQFNEDGDSRRKDETVVQMEDYADFQEEFKTDNTERNVDVTDLNNEYNVEYQDYLEEFADDMDIPREDNVSAMEVYQDNMSDDFAEDMDIHEGRSQENYLDRQEVKEAQEGMKDEESVMLENNMENMEKYKDSKADLKNNLNNEFSDAGYDNSVAMDSVKVQKSTMFSDKNVDPLTNQYPEGITEKTFQRTNNLGEVIEVTIVRIVVRGNKADEYRKVTSRWNTAYFKNGGVINEYIWDTETN